MKDLDRMNFEVWFLDFNGVRRRVAAFHYFYEAQKYVECFHWSNRDRFVIEEAED